MATGTFASRAWLGSTPFVLAKMRLAPRAMMQSTAALVDAPSTTLEDEIERLVRLQKARMWHPMTQQRWWNAGQAEPPPPLAASSGCVLRRMDGTQVLDMIAGLWCVNVGYGSTELAHVAYEAMLELPYHAPTMASPAQIELADTICESLGGSFATSGRVFMSTTGSEANEVAFKIARQYHALNSHRDSSGPLRYKIVSRHRAYHGNTAGALAATGQAERCTGFGPPPAGFVKVPAPYPYRSELSAEALAAQLEETLIHEGPETVAAFVCEPIISGGGVLVPPSGYLPAIRAVCDKYGILLILDEVVSGFGRTGAMFGFHHYDGARPDIVTMAKGLTSGYAPLGAVAVTSDIFRAFDGTHAAPLPPRLAHFRQISTYAGHPVSCAVALRNIQIVVRDNLIRAAAIMGDYLADALRAHLAHHSLVGEIRHKGLLIGIELVSDHAAKTPLSDDQCANIVQHCAQNGLIIGRNAFTVPNFTNVLILAPSFVITRTECDQAVHLLRRALDDIVR